MVVVKYSTAVNCYTTLNVTKLDILDGFPEIKVCVAYKHKGKELESFPGMSFFRWKTIPRAKDMLMG